MAAFYFANFSQKLTAYIIRAYWCFKRGGASAKIRQARWIVLFLIDSITSFETSIRPNILENFMI